MFDSTGTTIVGIKYKTGVILFADTRSTAGPVVSNKNCEKIHFISDKIMCCGAGTAADTRRVTRRASKELQIFAYKNMKMPYVTHAQRLIVEYLHGYQGQIEAALILGGIDINGIYLYSISPHGSSSNPEYASLGSGSFAAIAVLEDEFRKDMTEEEAIAVGVKAIKSGIMNDLYSGSNVDVCVIDINNGVKKHRNYLVVESRKDKHEIIYPADSVEIIEEQVINFS